MNNKTNHLLEKFLHIVDSNRTSCFKKQTDLNHFKLENLQILVTDILEVAPAIFDEKFSKWNAQYNLCHNSTESLSYLGLNIWDLVTKEIKELSSLSALKKATKKWKPRNCPFRLCKKYVQNICLIWYFFWYCWHISFPFRSKLSWIE